MAIDPNSPVRERNFASDNWSGICPEAMEALAAVNRGHTPAYGEDAHTTRACDTIRAFFETDCDVYFTFNGTAANSLALASLCRSYHSVLCHELAHLETDECGAPEFFSNGTKVLLVGGALGKAALDAVEERVLRRNDIHYPKPHVLSLTQPTEVGTRYTVEEVQAAGALAKKHGLRVHMDGARFGNALASLGVAPKAITWEAGVDVLCLGGAKNGMPLGEAVVFFDRALSEEFAYRCKQAGQLASKMRFLSAPWEGMLNSGAYLRNAAHANRAAARLAEGLEGLGVAPLYPCQANAVFVSLAPEQAAALRARGWCFHEFIGDAGARFMCSWDTADADVDALLADFARVAG